MKLFRNCLAVEEVDSPFEAVQGSPDTYPQVFAVATCLSRSPEARFRRRGGAVGAGEATAVAVAIDRRVSRINQRIQGLNDTETLR